MSLNLVDLFVVFLILVVIASLMTGTTYCKGLFRRDTDPTNFYGGVICYAVLASVLGVMSWKGFWDS
jgi:hypothetical protein